MKNPAIPDFMPDHLLELGSDQLKLTHFTNYNDILIFNMIGMT